MLSWLLALLIKPLFVGAFALAYYVVVYRGSHWLGRFIPDPLFDFLFRERGCFDPRRGLPAVRSGNRRRPHNTGQRLLK